MLYVRAMVGTVSLTPPAIYLAIQTFMVLVLPLLLWMY